MKEVCAIKSEAYGQNDGKWAGDPRLMQTNVVVCTRNCTLVGTAHILPQHRLLDDLNSSFVADLHRLGEEFIPLTEVRILYPSGEKDVALSTHVRKSSVLFVAERGAGQLERNGAREGKAHLSRVKKPLGVRVYLPPYVIEGKMHVGLWQELAQALDSDNRFLPMTDVVVSPPLLNGETAFPFAAMNKDQIVHISELSEAFQRFRQDAQRALNVGRSIIPEPVACPRP